VAINKQKVSASAQKNIQAGRWDRAIKDLRKITDEDPDDLRTLLKIGNVYERKADIAKAIATYTEVAVAYEEGGFAQKSAAVYKQILELDEDRTDVRETLGRLQHLLGLSRDAMTHYRTALELYITNGDKQGYGRVLGAMTGIDPTNIGLRIKFAEHLAKVNQIDAACHQFSLAARQLKEANRMDDYIKVVERLVYHKDTNTDYLKELVRAYLDDDKARRALSKLQSLYRDNPQDAATLEMLSEAFIALDQNDKAVKVLKELAHVYEDTRPDDDVAVRTWRRALALAPKDAEILEVLQELNDPLTSDVPMLDDSAIVALDDDVIAEMLPASHGQMGRLDSPMYDLSEEVDRLLTEFDACLRFNLIAQAEEHIEKLIKLDSLNVEVLERKVALLRRQGLTVEAAAELRVMAQEVWEKDKNSAMRFALESVKLDPGGPYNFNLLLSFGLDPSEYGIQRPGSQPVPPPAPNPPLPDVATRRPPPIPSPSLSINTNDLRLLGQARPSTHERPIYSTLPPDAFDVVDEEDTPVEASEAVGAQTLDRIHVDNDMELDLDDLDSLLEATNAVDEVEVKEEGFASMFDLDEDDFDDLFDEELLTSSMEVSLRGGTIPATYDISDEEEEESDEDELMFAPVGEDEEEPEEDLVVELTREELDLLTDELEEVDFFVAQGLVNEANGMLNDLEDRFGAHPLISGLRARL